MNILKIVRNINKSILSINDSLKTIYKNQAILERYCSDQNKIFQCSLGICNHLENVCLNLENICDHVSPMSALSICELIQKIVESMKNISNLVSTLFKYCLTIAQVVYPEFSLPKIQQIILSVKNIFESHLNIYDLLMKMIENLEF